MKSTHEGSSSRRRGSGVASVRAARSVSGIRLGYLVPEWPAQTHAFFWRELGALRALGVEVSLFSTRRPDTAACMHDFAEEARRATRYLFPPNALAALRVLTRQPTRTARALRYLATLSETAPRERAKLFGLLPSAATLVARAEKLQLTHVHAHSCANSAHLVHLAQLLGGPRFSLTLHGDLPVYGTDHARKMRGASFVAAVTRPLQQQLLESAGLEAARVPIIPMGVDTERFSPPRRHARKAVSGRLHITTIARLHPVKGHAFVLEALRRIRAAGIDAHYVIAGEGPHRQAIERQVHELGLESCVELRGTVSEHGVLELLQQSDVFLLASKGLGEAAPVSVMEAMACGLPVICSQIGGTADMIDDGKDGLLIAQGDVDALTAGLQRLAVDLDFRRQIGSAARERALSAFDFRRMAERFVQALERCAVDERTETAAVAP